MNSKKTEQAASMVNTERGKTSFLKEEVEHAD